MAFFNPDERKRQEQILQLQRENAALRHELDVTTASKTDLQGKMVEVFKTLHATEQKFLACTEVNKKALAEVERLGEMNKQIREERLGTGESVEQLELDCAKWRDTAAEYQMKLAESETAKLSLQHTVQQLQAEDELIRKQLQQALDANAKLEATLSLQQVAPRSAPEEAEGAATGVEAGGMGRKVQEAQEAVAKSRVNFELEAHRLQREYELGMLKQLRETFLNLQTLTGLTNSALRDSMKQIDHVLAREPANQ
jgi:hypothetical protein